MPSFSERLQHAWNAFTNNRDPTFNSDDFYGGISVHQPSYRPRRFYRNDRFMITAIINRIAIDVASISIQHVRLDENNRVIETIYDGLNECLTVEANIDQTSRAFIQDLTTTILEEGVAVMVPVDTTLDPSKSNTFDIRTMRVGRVTQWYPRYVRVELYNDRTGRLEELILPKEFVGIVQNPLYAVMNEPNSTLQRLIRKLAMLDVVDEQASSGKLDLIIQLPYVVKTDARRKEAEKRRALIENQLKDSKYGIAYIDGTEHITQLNRSLDNNLLKQVEYLTKLLYSQIGATEEVFNGTADEAVMLNYNNRTIEPIISSIVDEMNRKFLTKTARTQRHKIKFFKDPFKLVPVNQIAEIADKFTRNEIMTSNEIRSVIGMKPSDDPKADMLINSNLNHGPDEMGQYAQLTDGTVDVQPYEYEVDPNIQQ